jgi:hypothetical protein
MSPFLRVLRALLAGLSVLSLAACHGGGDDDEEPALGGVAEDADATGIWAGSVTIAGATRTFRVVVAPNGDFTASIFPTTPTSGNGRTIIGSGDTSGTALTASGTAFAPPTGLFPNGNAIAQVSVTNGSVTEGSTMSGTYSAGGESGPFTLTYQTALTSRGALLSRVAGTYSLFPPPTSGLNAVLTVQSTGIADFQASTGCVGNGSLGILDPAVNIYSVSFTLANCGGPTYTATGLAVLDDGPNGGANNMLALFAAGPQHERPFGFLGTK